MRGQLEIAMNLKSILLCAAALTLGACASSPTKLVSTWAAPGSAGFVPKKILVTCPAKELRLSAEVRMTVDPNSVTSTSVFSMARKATRTGARGSTNWYRHRLVMRPIAARQQRRIRPPSVSTYSSGPGLYGYWGSSYYLYDPVHPRKTVAVIETEVYAVEGEKLPDFASNTINERVKAVDTIIEATVESMRAGLINR
jgi:hypothetical protein